MKRLSIVAGTLLLLAQFGSPSRVLADPPGPPPPPTCKSCPGPPPPPTPLPTASPGDSTSQQVVNVNLAPTHISRGHVAKLKIMAQESAGVTIRIQYRGAKKASVSHSKVGSNGTLVKSWKIPKNAPLGTGQVKVDIEGEDEPFTATLTVTK